LEGGVFVIDGLANKQLWTKNSGVMGSAYPRAEFTKGY